MFGRFRRNRKKKQERQELLKPPESKQESQELSPFQLLPPEIVLAVFSYLNPAELAITSSVCSQFYAIAKDDLLWKQFLTYTDINHHEKSEKKAEQTISYQGLFFTWAKEQGFFASLKVPAQSNHDSYRQFSVFKDPFGNTQSAMVGGNTTVVTLLQDRNGLINCFFEFFENESPYILRLYFKPGEDNFSVRAAYISTTEARNLNELMHPIIRSQTENTVPGAFYHKKIAELAKSKKSIVLTGKENPTEWLETFLLKESSSSSPPMFSNEGSEHLGTGCLFGNFKIRKAMNTPPEEPKESKHWFGVR